MKITIRKAEKADYPFILRVNEENVEVLAPMDEAKLDYFMSVTDRLLIAEADGERAAFLIALREGVSGYTSENYIWFGKMYSSFLYVDRIVIDAPFRGIGIGRKLYETVFERAKESDVRYVLAEIDTIPYNKNSLAFHKAMGFREVGTQFVRDNTVKVSLQEAKVF